MTISFYSIAACSMISKTKNMVPNNLIQNMLLFYKHLPYHQHPSKYLTMITVKVLDIFQ